MKNILLFILLLVSCLGRSQAANQLTKYDLENDFSAEKLTAENKLAFENRAKQKIVDFCNYIALVSNKDYDEKLRLHSKETAIKLFNSEGCTIYDSLITKNEEIEFVPTYFDHLFQSTYQKIMSEAQNLMITEELSLTNKGSYLGKIQFDQVSTYFNAKGKLVHKIVQKKEAVITLSKKVKRFGETEKFIWSVHLCDIYLAVKN